MISDEIMQNEVMASIHRALKLDNKEYSYLAWFDLHARFPELLITHDTWRKYRQVICQIHPTG